MHPIKWLDAPEARDFPAAFSYLSLLFDEPHAASLVEMLRAAPMSEFHAKDVIRASGLHPLDDSNRHVARNLKKVKVGTALSPILLVRSDRLIICDGFHRASAVYFLDEDAVVPCKIV